VTSAFNIDKPTRENKVDVFKQALQMLSPDALSSFETLIPDWADGDETDSVTVSDKLFGSLVDRPTVAQTWDDIVNFFFGWTGQDRTREESQQAIADQAASVATLWAQLTALLNQQAAQGNSGNFEIIDFSDYSDSSSLPAGFAQTYSGLGTDFVWGIVSGKAAVYDITGDLSAGADNDPRTCLAPYTLKQTLTDYQMVGASFASSPETGGGSGADAISYLLGRSNAAGTEFVYAALTKFTWELGCVASGTQTVFASGSVLSGFSFKSTGNYWLQCGDVGGARVFKIMEGSNPIVTHTEVGTTSRLGASYRYTGMGEYTYGSFFSFNHPGRVTAFAFSDNTPPSFVGSGALMYRTSTTPVNVSNGVNLLPSGFWGAVGENTEDIACDVTAGTFTVSLTGWYNVGVRARTSSSFLPNGITWVLHKGTGAGSASPIRYGGNEHTRGVNSSNVAYIPQGFHAVWNSIYLAAGDYVQIGYDSTSSVSGVLSGEAVGQQTYFSIALTNKSLA
jgi:hypothetical protein